MIRAILVLLGLVAIVLVVLLSFGMISLQQTDRGALPSVHVDGGKAPQFEADVGKVEMGTVNKTIQVPSLTVEKAQQVDNSQD